MDISTTLNKKTTSPFFKPKLMLLVAIVSLLIVSMWALSSGTSTPTPPNEAIRIATVEQGDFSVKVDGYGRLKAKYQRLLTSQSQAIVERIELYPGAKVKKDSVILTLLDPALEQAVVTARLELARQQAELKEQTISHQSQLLERDAQIALLNSDLENAELHAEAEKKLFDKNIVSVLDYKRTLLDVRQLGQRLDIEKARQTHLKAMQQERINIQKDLITQYELNYQNIKSRFERLTVRAGLDGVLQTLPVEIGQSVTTGTQLAMVGSDQQLVAQLRVQQNQADQIAIGMNAVVSTFGNVIDAKVLRIDPIVTEGRVMIELDLTGDLPANARPDLTVEGQILVKEIQNTLFIQQPSNSSSFQTKNIFKLTDDTKTAQLTSIEFGTLSGNQIEVINGAQVGDKLIVSDMTQWISAQSVQIQN